MDEMIFGIFYAPSHKRSKTSHLRNWLPHLCFLMKKKKIQSFNKCI